MFQITFDMSACVYQAGAEGEKSVARQGGKKKRPFGLMCEDPHTYLTERFTTVGICSKPLQREKNRNRKQESAKHFKKRSPAQQKIDITETEKETVRAEE